MSHEYVRRQAVIKKPTTKDCGYNHRDYCGCEESDHYFLKCLYKFFMECPVHNEELEE